MILTLSDGNYYWNIMKSFACKLVGLAKWMSYIKHTRRGEIMVKGSFVYADYFKEGVSGEFIFWKH
jgi:hypothetical protein